MNRTLSQLIDDFTVKLHLTKNDAISGVKIL